MRLHAEQDYWLQTHLFRIFNKVFILPFRRSEWIHHPFSPLCLLRHTQMLLSTCFARIAHLSSQLGWEKDSSQQKELNWGPQPRGCPSFPPFTLLKVMFQGGESSPCDHSMNRYLNASLQNSSLPPLFNARDQCKSLHERQHDIEGDTTALRHFQSCRRIQLFLHPGPGAVRVLLTFCADPSCIFPSGFYQSYFYKERDFRFHPKHQAKLWLPFCTVPVSVGESRWERENKTGKEKKKSIMSKRGAFCLL